ncbi:hypothetical protein [Streptomyces geranii]|uniref:hypothetical protein n=1 Tax=Streptomyces geranii TaxID=2058923 RepID=UPI0013003867|nr:hypothetical protein [Streptomyces geranii]
MTPRLPVAATPDTRRRRRPAPAATRPGPLAPRPPARNTGGPRTGPGTAPRTGIRTGMRTGTHTANTRGRQPTSGKETVR